MSENNEDYTQYPVVWLSEYRTFGWLLQQGAHFSTVVFHTVDGLTKEQVENDEYITWEEKSIDYESD